MIPRRPFQYWDTGNPPDEVARLIETWPEVNPGFEHRVWSRDSFLESLDGSPWQDTIVSGFAKCRHPSFESDIMRLVELHRSGGVYVDADHEAIAPIEGLWQQNTSLMILRKPNGNIPSGLSASIPGHPFVDALLHSMLDALPSASRETNMWTLIGPGLWRRSARHFAFAAGDLILPWSDAAKVQRVHNDLAYKVDHWSGVHPLQLRNAAADDTA